MDLEHVLEEKKVVITSFLDGFFAGKMVGWEKINRWGPDGLVRLASFVKKGKMLRGALVLLTAEMLGVPEDKSLPAAAAMELLQASLLVHDDIMDEDALRRGDSSLHKQYESLGVEEGVERADHFGMSMGVCFGDASLFLAYEVLAECNDASLIQLFSELAAIVGMGQMQDVFWGQHRAVPSDEDILAMYEHKTAMYTFCLPFLLATRISGRDELAPSFDSLGKLLGKLFQIKDDELGLYGDDWLGKPVGSDVLMGKKTIYYSLLLSLASAEEKESLRLLQVADELSEDAMVFVKVLLEKYAVRSLVAKDVGVLVSAATSLIDGLEIADEWKLFLHSLIVFNSHRIK